MTTPSTVVETNIPGLPAPQRGKVRDIYDLGDKLLLVASDRLSAFDVVLPTPIPDKGKVLNRISEFWFDFMKEVVPNQVLETDAARYPEPLRAHAAMLADRSMLVKKTERLPVECVARGYLVGSGWVEYQEKGSVSGIPLPPGLRQAEKLPEPIFTPSTKADVGHDENISIEEVGNLIGRDRAGRLKELTLAIYSRAADYARGKGIILADTKFEFGMLGGEIIWIDEALTPDSSRFWPADTYEVGTSPASYDKQFVRDYLLAIKWDKKPPAPALPADVVEKTRQKYREAYRVLTGKELP
ncbi:MAG: phosphoribosylaminoimidazolesuccinocarboxamide synthase [Acidobacteriota bacterium]